MKYLPPIAQEIGDKLEKSQNEGKQEIADLEEKLKVLQQEQALIYEEILGGYMEAVPSKQKRLHVDIQFAKQWIKFAKDYPSIAHSLTELMTENEGVKERLKNLENSDRSFPLTKYSYSKRKIRN